MPNPESSHMKRARERAEMETEIRRALDPETGKPFPQQPPRQFLQGKLTAICLLVSGIGAAGRLFGVVFPADVVNGILQWIAANYDALLFVGGQLGAAWGQLRRNWRAAA